MTANARESMCMAPGGCANRRVPAANPREPLVAQARIRANGARMGRESCEWAAYCVKPPRESARILANPLRITVNQQ